MNLNDVEKEAIEKLDDTGYFPTFKYEEERMHEEPVMQYRFSVSRIKSKYKLSIANSYYAVLEAGLEDISGFLYKIRESMDKGTRLWLEPSDKGYRLTIISYRSGSKELTSLLPALRELSKSSKAKMSIIRPLDSLVENPDNKQMTTLGGEPLTILPTQFFLEILKHNNVRDIAGFTLELNKLSSLEEIIRYIEDTGIARITSVLSTRMMEEPVGALINFSVNKKLSRNEIETVATYIAEVLRLYVKKAYGIETAYKINKISPEKTEVFLYRPDRIKY